MNPGDLLFAGWWYAVCGVLGLGACLASRRGVKTNWNHALVTFLIGVAAALVLYAAPGGLHDIRSIHDLELRFVGALAIAWLAGELMTRRSEGSGISTIATAGFVGVNLPPLAFLASVYMVSGGQPFTF